MLVTRERRRDRTYTGRLPEPEHPDRRKLLGYIERVEDLPNRRATCDHNNSYIRPCAWCDKEIARRAPQGYAGG